MEGVVAAAAIGACSAGVLRDEELDEELDADNELAVVELDTAEGMLGAREVSEDEELLEM
jgi:hypothetical protein